MNYLKEQSGAALLISLLVISALALVLAVGVNLSAIDDVLRSSQSRYSLRSEAAADSCLDEALIRLKWDVSYSGGNIDMDEGSCSVSVSGAGSLKSISVSGSAGNSVTELLVEVDLSGTSPIINSWAKGG
ncbi:MAG: hypothetical protein ABIE03_00585 [Patescibacteria group bacterium]|nr:hypothetical protein [Patescibacteria group bacterium]